MKNQVRQIVESLALWGQSLTLPLPQDQLQNLWHSEFISLLSFHSISDSKFEKLLPVVRQVSFQDFVQKNSKAINLKLEQISEEYVFRAKLVDFDVNIEEVKDMLQIAETVIQRGVQEINNYCDQMIRKIHESRKNIELKQVISEFKEQIYSVLRLKFPILYDKVKKVFDQISMEFIENLKNFGMRSQIQSLREINSFMENALFDYSQALKTAFENGLKAPLSMFLYEKYYNMLVQITIEQWESTNSSRLAKLIENYINFVIETVPLLVSKEISLFDQQFLSQQAKFVVAKILMISIQNKKELPRYYMLMDDLFQIFGFSEQQIQRVIESSYENQELAQDSLGMELNQLTDYKGRIMTILNVILFISGSYKILIEGQQGQIPEYSGWKRQWIINFINYALQRKYQTIMSSNLSSGLLRILLFTQEFIQTELLKRSGQERKNQNMDYSQQAASLYKNSLDSSNSQPQIKLSQSSMLDTLSIRNFMFKSIKNQPSIHITIAISGWLSQQDKMKSAWSQLMQYPDLSQIYSLKWDSSSAGRLVSNIATNLTHLSKVYTKGIKGLSQFFQVQDIDPFKKSSKQAELTGKVLARMIDRGVFGSASVSLIGFSLGTRVIFYCLQQLQALKSKKIHDVLLLGGACSSSSNSWKICRQAVSGRLINTYCKTDRILSMLYTISKFERPIGTNKIEVQGIENYNVTHFCQGHLQYRDKLLEILRYTQFNK